MQEITVLRKSVNIPQLEGEIRAVFQGRYHGLSTDQQFTRLFVDDDFSQVDTEAIEALYEAHVPTETDEAATERKRRTVDDAIAALKEVDFDAIDTLVKARNVLRLMRYIIVRD